MVSEQEESDGRTGVLIPRVTGSTTRAIVQEPAASSQDRTIEARGIYVQWPFSRLLVSGMKLVEDRVYDLGHKNIGLEKQEMFLVETCKKVSLSRDVSVDCSQLEPGPPSGVKRVIGIITFSESMKYRDLDQWRASQHCIAPETSIDQVGWDGSGDRYGWLVGHVRAVVPQVVDAGGMTGFKERTLKVRML